MSAEITLNTSELRELVADTLDVESSALTDDALFIEELGVDSVVALELAVTLEQRYGIRIPEEELVELRTFPDIRDLLSRKLGG
ncbi:MULTISPECIES: acyl carrier protein [unclassified Streptomyces]|uniref:acyl carrier protein n=1 Tax=unclassified Streptomyces TaxID=2593676 RepID=UPI000AA45171|nr:MULTISPECIES: acyl carrier protein [unclassified Streptomyces]WRZ73408.1 acyl carrier protein [Streptomyces sp. NBC_01237]